MVCLAKNTVQVFVCNLLRTYSTVVFVCLVTVSYHCRSKHEQKRQQRYLGVQLGLLVGITMVMTSISLDIAYGFGSQEE